MATGARGVVPGVPGRVSDDTECGWPDCDHAAGFKHDVRNSETGEMKSVAVCEIHHHKLLAFMP